MAGLEEHAGGAAKGIVGEEVLPCERAVLGGVGTTGVKVGGEAGGDVTAGFLDVVDDVGVIHEVPLAVRDELFEVVRQ